LPCSHAHFCWSRARNCKADTTIARETLKLYFEPERGVFPKAGEIDVKGFEEVLRVMAEAGELKAPIPPAERFIDLQYLKAAGLQ
jgi:hypothetical protein